jgi:predicted methyltransferase
MRVLRETKFADAVQDVNNFTIASEVRSGDAFDLIRECAAESIDLLITSPPYWGLRTYDFEHNWRI